MCLTSYYSPTLTYPTNICLECIKHCGICSNSQTCDKCRLYATKTKEGICIVTKSKLALILGLAIGIPALIIFCYIYYLCRKKKQKQQERDLEYRRESESKARQAARDKPSDILNGPSDSDFPGMSQRVENKIPVQQTLYSDAQNNGYGIQLINMNQQMNTQPATINQQMVMQPAAFNQPMVMQPAKNNNF